MSNTTRMMMLDKSLKISEEGQWQLKNDYDYLMTRQKPAYTSFNDAGLECEVGEFMYGMVRILQPDRVLETGTHWGVGASYIGLGLLDNKKGFLDTIEFLPEIHVIAQDRIKRLGLTKFVECHLSDARTWEFDKTIRYDLMLFDTEPQTRFEELLRYYPYLNEGGYIFIHDLHRHMGQMPNEEHGYAWPWGKLPEELKDLVKNDKLRPFHFSTPRGLCGFYKVKSDDYRWT